VKHPKVMDTGRRRTPGFFSRISFRLLAFNLLIVFLPIGALLYLDTYERQLLQALEHAMVQQGRVLAAALSAETNPDSPAPAHTGDPGRPAIDAVKARRILLQLERRHEARLRVVDADGRLLVDSSLLGSAAGGVAGRGAEPVDLESRTSRDARAETSASAADSLLYRLGSAPVRLYRRVFRPPEPPLESAEYYVGVNVLQGPEIRDALAGRYGALTRISTGGQRSVTLYSAIPVRTAGAEAADSRAASGTASDAAVGTPGGVIGAVLVSQSTYRILRDLYELRVQIFTILLAAIAAAVALSLVASTTIVVPIGRLRRQAREILDHRGRLRGHFRPPRRRDEIGELSRALHELTQTIEGHLRFMESFASDLSHELKNPLATIRSAAEMLGDTQNQDDRRRFLGLIQQEVARTEALATAMRDISRIDTQLEEEERQLVDLRELCEGVVESLRLRSPVVGAAFTVEPLPGDGGASAPSGSAGPPTVDMSPTRAAQVLENLLDNAASFSPREVRVLVGREKTAVRILVLDRGPGIPEGSRERIFDRFFTFRPELLRGEVSGSTGGETHLGLGLAIVRAIVGGYGGSVTAGNREGGGAFFEVLLPAAER